MVNLLFYLQNYYIEKQGCRKTNWFGLCNCLTHGKRSGKMREIERECDNSFGQDYIPRDTKLYKNTLNSFAYYINNKKCQQFLF